MIEIIVEDMKEMTAAGGGVDFGTQVLFSTLQHFAYQGNLPSEFVQYLFANPPLLHTAPAHPVG